MEKKNSKNGSRIVCEDIWKPSTMTMKFVRLRDQSREPITVTQTTNTFQIVATLSHTRPHHPPLIRTHRKYYDYEILPVLLFFDHGTAILFVLYNCVTRQTIQHVAVRVMYTIHNKLMYCICENACVSFLCGFLHKNRLEPLEYKSHIIETKQKCMV